MSYYLGGSLFLTHTGTYPMQPKKSDQIKDVTIIKAVAITLAYILMLAYVHKSVFLGLPLSTTESVVMSSCLAITLSSLVISKLKGKQ